MTITCPACGEQVDTESAHCPSCGAELVKAPPVFGVPTKRKTGMDIFLNVLATLAFILVGLPALVGGGCLLILGGGQMLGPEPFSRDPSLLVVAFGGFVLFGLLLWLMVRQGRK